MPPLANHLSQTSLEPDGLGFTPVVVEQWIRVMLISDKKRGDADDSMSLSQSVLLYMQSKPETYIARLAFIPCRRLLPQRGLPACMVLGCTAGWVAL